MNGLNRITLALLTLAAAPAVQAATEFDEELPAEVVTQVFNAVLGGQVRVYADVPDGFPAFEMPRDMTILAGIDQGYSQRVILKSQFDPQAATALAYGALLDSGWELVPQPGMPQQTTGFINPYQPVPPTQLCHADYGMVQVNAQMGLGATYVNIMRNVVPPGTPVPGCTPPDQQMAMMNQMPEPYRLMQEAMPRLVLPNTAGMQSSGGYDGGGGGGPNEWEVRAQLNGGWDIARVYEYFKEQIEQQDWNSDAEIVGSEMAAGSWTKTAEDGAELVGSLNVQTMGEGSYDLRFRLIRKGAFGPGMGSRVLRDSVIGVYPVQVDPLGPPLNAPALGIRGIPAGAVIRRD